MEPRDAFWFSCVSDLKFSVNLCFSIRESAGKGVKLNAFNSRNASRKAVPSYLGSVQLKTQIENIKEMLSLINTRNYDSFDDVDCRYSHLHSSALNQS